MNSSVAVAAQPYHGAGQPWHRGPKADQWIAFWSVPIFYSLFGLVFVPLSWMMPPRPPSNALPDVVAFMQSPNLLIACVILVLTIGMSGLANACYLVQMRRMSVSPVFRFSMIVGSITGAIVGCLFPMFCFGLGAFRPGYDPEILALLYDFGYLSFIGSMGCFCLMWGAFGLSIILDQNNILPKWLGYYTIWQYMSELIIAPVWITKSGPFAWDGLASFYLAMVLYVPWQLIVYYRVYKAIRDQPERELDNVPATSEAVYY